METTNEPSDKILEATADALTETWTNPSTIARRAKITTGQAHAALKWLTANQMATATGNGSWTKYRNRRFGEVTA
jgi:hypothetical protein